MVGGGPFGLEPGQWTDDTSMALCLAESLLERGGLDPHDVMRRFVRWWRHGELSCTGECFDIGTTVADALGRYEETGDPLAGSTHPRAAGNGSIMRLAPVALWHARDEDAAERDAALSSRLTHGAEESVDACRLLARMLVRAMRGASKLEVLLGDAETFEGAPAIVAIARGEHLARAEPDIDSSAYVVHCLEAATWCLARTETFRDAVLAAANLAEDADTTAAVCGQLAGALYGVDAIPAGWLLRLAWRDRIERLEERLRAPR